MTYYSLCKRKKSHNSNTKACAFEQYGTSGRFSSRLGWGSTGGQGAAEGVEPPKPDQLSVGLLTRDPATGQLPAQLAQGVAPK